MPAKQWFARFFRPKSQDHILAKVAVAVGVTPAELTKKQKATRRLKRQRQRAARKVQRST